LHQFSQCTDRIKDLEKLFVNPDSKGRVRFIKGKDLTEEEMIKKLDMVRVLKHPTACSQVLQTHHPTRPPLLVMES
jgi:hypothetical protein